MTQTTVPTLPDDDLDPGPRPTALGSALRGLREQTAAARAELTIDLKVPRLDNVFVRFRPAEFVDIRRANLRHEKSKKADKEIVIQAVILAGTCEGVYLADAEGVKHSADLEHPEDPAPCFDERLAELLGVEATGAVDIVRALYVTDGDLTSTANSVAEFSGFANDELIETSRGN